MDIGYNRRKLIETLLSELTEKDCERLRKVAAHMMWDQLTNDVVSSMIDGLVHPWAAVECPHCKPNPPDISIIKDYDTEEKS